MNSIVICGCSKTGMLAGVVLAHKHKDKKVTFIGSNQDIEQLNKGGMYSDEPLFTGYYESARNIDTTTSYDILNTADIIIVSSDCINNDGTFNYFNIDKHLDNIRKKAKAGAIVIFYTIFDIGRTNILVNQYLRKDLHVAHIPPFIVEGEAIKSLIDPHTLVIGYHNKTDIMMTKIRALYYYVNYDDIIETDCTTSELSKLASNFMLAQRISTINSFEYLANEKHANILDIIKVLKKDSRIGSDYMSPSAGFGGGNFNKVINCISRSCMDTTFNTYFGNAGRANHYHMVKIAQKIGHNKRVLFLGYGYKEHTSSTERSPTSIIIQELANDVEYNIYDIHHSEYNKKPEGDYDYVILMLNEKEYIDIAKQYPENKIIDPKYLMTKI